MQPQDGSPPGSSIHGISQTRIMEWATISFSRRSSPLRDQTHISCIAGRFFTSWATTQLSVCWYIGFPRPWPYTSSSDDFVRCLPDTFTQISSRHLNIICPRENSLGFHPISAAANLFLPKFSSSVMVPQGSWKDLGVILDSSISFSHIPSSNKSRPLCVHSTSWICPLPPIWLFLYCDNLTAHFLAVLKAILHTAARKIT